MCADNFELEPDDHFNETCGKILSTSKGLFVFICTLCDRKYLYCENLLSHYSQEHILLEESKADIDVLNTAPETDLCSDEQNVSPRNESVNHLSNCLSQKDPLAINSNNNGSSDLNGFKEETPEENLHSSGQRQTNGSAIIEKQSLVSNAVKCDLIEVRPPRISEKDKKESSTKKDGFIADTEGSLKKNRKKQRCKLANPLKSLLKKPRIQKQKSMRRREPAQTNVLESIPVTSHIRCLMCPVIFMEESEFREHMKEHETFTCLRCSSSFISKNRFELHFGRKCNAFKRPLKCHLCDFIFEYKVKLHHHLLRHFPPTEYVCKRCSAVFESRSDLKQHTRNDHSTDKRYECHICGASILRKSNLKKHVLHHSDENRKFQCANCPKRFFQKSDLRFHFLLVHSKERPHLCSECGASFALKTRLNKHVKKHHTVVESTFSCELCSKMFRTKQTLSRHLAVHSDERNHVCSTCKATFKTRKTLVQHLKIHENKRAYKCELCQKGFNQRPALVSHMKSHM